jgi:hypothetical protein
MPDFQSVPWKRNITRLSAEVISKLNEIPQDVAVEAVCTKHVSASELRAGLLKHLNIEIKGNKVSFPQSIIPPANMGKYSEKNCHGWEVKRRDLPKIWKSVPLGVRPNFGDWSKGSFSLWQDREVYQVEEYAPRDFTIDIDLLRESDEGFSFKFRIGCTLDRNNTEFEDDLLFCLNILQENVGMCGVDRSDKTREEYIETILVDWEIFPPGSVDRFLAKAKAAARRGDGDTNEIIEERVKQFKRLSPEKYILGKGGFNRYIGAVLPGGKVVFENLRWGNALYVLYDEWEDISRRSRFDLIQGTSDDYERIPHVQGWEMKLRQAVR